MIVSGILVMTSPDALARVRQTVSALPWADAHAQEASGRFIVTVEASDSDEGQERLKALRLIPGVLAAEMVIHCFEDEALALTEPDPQVAADILNQGDGPPNQRSFYSRLKAVGNY